VTALGQFLTSAAAKMVFFDGTKWAIVLGLKHLIVFLGPTNMLPTMLVSSWSYGTK
jgi:hypothetical protein